MILWFCRFDRLKFLFFFILRKFRLGFLIQPVTFPDFSQNKRLILFGGIYVFIDRNEIVFKLINKFDVCLQYVGRKDFSGFLFSVKIYFKIEGFTLCSKISMDLFYGYDSIPLFMEIVFSIVNILVL